MNKRKVLSILLLALITVTLAVSCSGSIDAPAQDAEELAYVTFGNGHSRGLSTSYETEPYNLLYWFYTARKTDSYGTTGETADLEPVSTDSNRNPVQGLSGQVGPFSQGAWKFKLYAYGYTKTGEDTDAIYAIDRNKLVYESDEVSVTLKGNEVKNVPVSVSTQGSNGYVKFNNAFFKWEGNSGNSKPTMEITLTPATGSAITNTITLNNKGADGKLTITNGTKVVSSESVDTIPADFYTANVIVYLKDDDLGIDNKGTPVFSQTFGLRVYGNATTYISGDMVEDVFSSVTFDVADKEMVVFSPDDDGAASFSVAVSPKGATSGSGHDTKTTRVEFPARALAGAEYQLDVAVTPIASAEQNFQISGDANTETAVAGIDFRMVKVEEQSGSLMQTPVTTFNGQSVTVTTYIATGLSSVTVKYLNDGVPTDTGISAVTYNSGSGLLTFKTNHFSQYVVVAPVEAVNVSTGIPYATLASAIECAGDGQEIQLKDNVNVSSAITVDKNLTIDLNGKSITGTSTRIFHVTAGTLELAGTGNVTSNGPNTGSFSDQSSVIRVGNNGSISPKIKAGLIVGSGVTINGPASYGVTVFGSQTVETVVVNGTITSSSGAVSGNGSQAYGGTTIIINEGASLSATNASGIYHPQSGDLIINGGTISGTTGIEIKSGNASVSVSGNPVITATGNIDHSASSNGNSSSGYSVAVVKNSSYTGDVTVEIESGSFTGPVCLLKDSDSSYNFSIKIKGGTFSSDPSTYIADGCTVAQNEASKYIVTKNEMWLDEADITWYDDSKSSFNITTEKELAGLAVLVNSGKTFSGKTISITDDINLAGKSWTPIGANADSAAKFQGTLDGSNHIISNMKVSQGASYRAAGFFGALNGIVKNLVFDTATVTSLSAPNSGGSTDNGNAVVAGSIYTSGTIENVTVKRSSVSANRYVGGIAGYVYGKVENCTVENTVLTATPDNLTGAYDNGDKIGGVVGYLAEGSNNIVKNCNVSGNTIITGYRDIGGVVGYANAQTTVSGNTISGGKITVDNTHNYKGYTAGALHDANPIVGEASGSANVTNNSGDSSVTITLPSYPQL